MTVDEYKYRLMLAGMCDLKADEAIEKIRQASTASALSFAEIFERVEHLLTPRTSGEQIAEAMKKLEDMRK